MFRHLIVVLGCIHLLGGPYGVLQVIAWTGMIVSYSQTEGISKGLAQTFDGEHPCSLCVAIVDAKKDDNDKQPLSGAPDKLSLKELTLPAQITLREPRSSEPPARPYLEPSANRMKLLVAPPIPPPRSFA
ncbi:hypothetical protein [Haloferula sp.]|uniref:hypothetical protein n=1 Tax=Haloferula sp. TaxID=2497595 RepID=UPI003C760B2D